MSELLKRGGHVDLRTAMEEIQKIYDENEQLRAQIEKMKNCGNCSKNARFVDRKDCENFSFFKRHGYEPLVGCSRWELEE